MSFQEIQPVHGQGAHDRVQHGHRGHLLDCQEGTPEGARDAAPEPEPEQVQELGLAPLGRTTLLDPCIAQLATVSQPNPILDTRISVRPPPSVTLRGPPLDSEMGWTGELWCLMSNYLGASEN